MCYANKGHHVSDRMKMVLYLCHLPPETHQSSQKYVINITHTLIEEHS